LSRLGRLPLSISLPRTVSQFNFCEKSIDKIEQLMEYTASWPLGAPDKRLSSEACGGNR
jgi:hypothetical protein